jgi:hypothetical protein
VRLRDQSGQTATDYMGVLLLVSVVVATIVASDLPRQIVAPVKQHICSIAHTGSCPQGAPRERSDRPERAARTPRRSVRAAVARVPPPPDPPSRPQRPPQGEVDDYGGGLEKLLFGEQYVLIDGEIVEVEQNGISGALRGIGRFLGIGKRAYNAAKERAKPLKIPTGLLLASEKVARVRARDLQNLLPPIERERFKTMAVGVGRDPSGRLRVVIGCNNPNGVLPASVRGALRDGEQVARGMGTGHAEGQILRWMAVKNWQPITVGAGRPICTACGDAIARSGATAASRLK